MSLIKKLVQVFSVSIIINNNALQLFSDDFNKVYIKLMDKNYYVYIQRIIYSSKTVDYEFLFETIEARDYFMSNIKGCSYVFKNKTIVELFENELFVING